MSPSQASETCASASSATSANNGVAIMRMRFRECQEGHQKRLMFSNFAGVPVNWVLNLSFETRAFNVVVDNVVDFEHRIRFDKVDDYCSFYTCERFRIACHTWSAD